MNVAVVGLGKIGIMHTAMVRSIPGANLVALIDREPKLGRHVQSMMSRPAPFFTSIADARKNVEFKGVLVCTPQFAHRSVAEECLEAGLDVFVEKPLAHKLEDAEAMTKALAKHPGAIAAVGYMKAHEGLTREVAQLIADGIIGTVETYEATCFLSQVFSAKKGWIYTPHLSGGGMVINSTCHLLHVLYRWFGKPKSLSATCKSVYSTDVEDEADVHFEYPSFSGRVHTSWSTPGYDVETSVVKIHGSNGSLEADSGGYRLELHEPCKSWDAGIYHRSRWEFERSAFNLSPNYGGEGYYCEDEDFIDACRTRRPANVSWNEGLEIQRQIDAIYKSNGTRIELAGGNS